MRRALPAIAVSAAGVTWLLHAQGVIDAAGAPTAAPSSTPPSTAARRAPSSTTPPSTPSTTAPRSGGGPATTTPSTAPTTPTSSPTGSGGAGTTVTGPSVSTKFGPVQVAVVVGNGAVTDVTTLQAPHSARRSQQINDRALPILRQEAVAAQSSDIDSVSGATITSDAYATSLQAALDAAGLAR